MADQLILHAASEVRHHQYCMHIVLVISWCTVRQAQYTSAVENIVWYTVQY